MTKLLYGILIALTLFLASMIDMRGEPQLGTCYVNGWEFGLVYNLDCKGIWKSN